MKISSLDSKTYTISSDINKDGKEDVKKIENKGYNGVTLAYNDKVFYNEDTMRAVSDVYIADLDESDNKLDLIVYADVDYTYNIFAFNGNNFEFRRKSQDVIRNNMYIDGKGNVISPSIDSTPIISNKYYSYKQDKYIDLSVDSVKDTLVTFKNAYFTEDLSNIEKAIENMNIGFAKALEKANIEEVSNIKAYILEFNNQFGDEIKVKLEDGRTGYLFIGHFAG